MGIKMNKTRNKELKKFKSPIDLIELQSNHKDTLFSKIVNFLPILIKSK